MSLPFRQDPTLPEGFSTTFRKRFWDKVFIVTYDRGCWLWMAACFPNGYGKACKGASGDLIGAHCASWILHFGPIPEGMFVCHHCDNPPCIRPDHLFLGTSKDNTQDMMSKGRHGFELPAPRPGESNPMARLTEAQVQQIRRIYVPREMSQSALGRRFGVSQTLIGLIVRRKIWTHV
jgi:HNH endonuclease